MNDEIEETQRQRTKILRYRRYRLEDEPLNFYREHILLFFPWRNECDDVENQNCEEIYKINEEQILQKKRQFSFITDENIDEINEELTRRYFEVENNEAEEFIEHQIPNHQMVDIFAITKINSKKRQISNRITAPLKIEKENIMKMME